MDIPHNQLTARNFLRGAQVVVTDDDRSYAIKNGSRGVITGKDGDGFYQIRFTELLIKNDVDPADVATYQNLNRDFYGFADQDLTLE